MNSDRPRDSSQAEEEYQVLGETSLADSDCFTDVLWEVCPGDELSVTFEVDGETVTVEGRVSSGAMEGDGDCSKVTRWIQRENAVDHQITFWDHPIEHYARIHYGGGKTVSEMNKAVVSEFESIKLTKTDRGLRTA